MNLAAGMAAAGVGTVLVEADLRRPMAHDYFGVPFSPGLSDVLTYRLDLADAVRLTRIPDLFFLPAGMLPPNPSELLGSARMRDVLEELDDVSDLVVLDTPPSLPVTDSALIAPQRTESFSSCAPARRAVIMPGRPRRSSSAGASASWASC